MNTDQKTFKVTIERWVKADTAQDARFVVINQLLTMLLSPIEGMRDRELATWVAIEDDPYEVTA